MKTLVRLMITLLISLQAYTASADVLVLVHGYMSDSRTWDYSGVTQGLSSDGWQHNDLAGQAVSFPRLASTRFVSAGLDNSHQNEKIFYTVELPSLAPVMIQARYLTSMLNEIGTRHPEQSIILVGHSAGGVVARAALIVNSFPKVKALITIASPNAGTVRALQAMDATDSSGPVGMFKRLFGGSQYHAVRNSWGILQDLAPARPGNLLYWLNQQRHPDISYHAIIHLGPNGQGDELIPAYSQALSTVANLKDRTEIHYLASPHQLGPQDGMLLGRILNNM